MFDRQDAINSLQDVYFTRFFDIVGWQQAVTHNYQHKTTISWNFSSHRFGIGSGDASDFGHRQPSTIDENCNKIHKKNSIPTRAELVAKATRDLPFKAERNVIATYLFMLDVHGSKLGINITLLYYLSCLWKLYSQVKLLSIHFWSVITMFFNYIIRFYDEKLVRIC